MFIETSSTFLLAILITSSFAELGLKHLVYVRKSGFVVLEFGRH
jgi:hypothetical protein